MRRAICLFLILFCFSYICFPNRGWSEDSYAREKETELTNPSVEGLRTARPFGFDISLGAPFPSAAGGMIGVNIYDALRVSVGAGSLIYWITYTADLKAFITRAAFSPYISAGVSALVGHESDIFGYSLNFDRVVAPYIGGGIDYTMESGMHFGAGVAIAPLPGALVVFPSASVGWYF